MSAALAVVLGAFGAHALRARLTAGELAGWETAARYQMYHALALLVLGRLFQHHPAPAFRLAARAFLAGILLFSGSLYLLALSGQRWLGAVTPAGGAAFLVGWVAFLAGVRRS